jgi:hypothetical protein
MSTMNELKKILQSLTLLVKTIETNMTTLNVYVDLCFDNIDKLEAKHDDGGSSECFNKVKHMDEEEGYNNNHSFSYCSHNMMPRLPKVDLNKFDG